MTSQYGHAALATLNDSNDLQMDDEASSCCRDAVEAGRGGTRQGIISPKTSLLCRLKTVLQSNVGLLLVVASQAFMSFMNVAVKKLNSLDPPVPALELVVVRMGITYMCCMTYMLSRNVPDPWLGPKGVRVLLVLRGVTGFFGLFGLYYSLQYLSLSDAVVLTFLSPLTTAIAGSCLLGESFTRKEALAGVFSLFGVVLIARPAFLFSDTETSLKVPDASHTQRLIAVGVALLGVLGSTGAYTTLRAIGKRAHPLHAMTSFSAQSIIVASIGLIVTQTKIVFPTRIEWLALLVMIGIFGFIAQVLLTMGLQRETASRGSLGIYTQIVFAGILERIFFRTTPSALSVIGTLTIITSALYVVLTKETGASGSRGKPVALEQLDEIAMEEGLLSHPIRDGSELGDAEHLNDDDFMAGVTSPSMKRAPSPMPKGADADALSQSGKDEKLGSEGAKLEDNASH